MKAILWQGDDRFEVHEAPDPAPKPGQALVQVEAAAVCGSDYHLADFGAKPPLIPGHEAAGTIVAVAADVSTGRVGQRVALDPVQRCGQCWCCRNGVEHLCQNCRHLGDRDTAGAWAQYVAIDAANAHPIPEGISFAAASMTEPTAVCYESFQRAQLAPGQRVLIIGDGPFGFLHAQIAKALGAGPIVVAGHYDSRLARIAKATGATVCNTRNQDLRPLLDRTFDGLGADVVIEATGSSASASLGIETLRPRGTIVIFSYVWKPQPLPMGLIHMRELNVLGSCRSQGAYGPCLQMMADGKVDPGLLVDLQAPLAECRQVVGRLKQDKGNIFKAVFRPQEC